MPEYLRHFVIEEVRTNIHGSDIRINSRLHCFRLGVEGDLHILATMLGIRHMDVAAT